MKYSTSAISLLLFLQAEATHVKCGQQSEMVASAPSEHIETDSILPVPADSSVGSSEPSDWFGQSCLSVHNELRSQVEFLNGTKINPVSWDTALVADAQKWADHLAKVNIGKGNPRPHSDFGHGENVNWYSMYDEHRNCSYALNQHFNEYDRYHNQPFGEGVGKYGHFTQLVWPNSTTIGCAYADTNDNGREDYEPRRYIVCEYEPPGNRDQEVLNVRVPGKSDY